jgi:hypothetical protein
MNSLPLVANWEAEWLVGEWPVGRQQARESPAELPAAAPDAAVRTVWQACLPLAELPDGEQPEQGLQADLSLAGLLRAQSDAHRVKLELAVGLLPLEMRLPSDSAFVRAPLAVPGPRLAQTIWPPEIMLFCR